MNATDLSRLIADVVRGHAGDPFAVLGCHRDGDAYVVRSFQPEVAELLLIDSDGAIIAPMRRVHPAGMFEGELPARCHYRLRASDRHGQHYEFEDPYRFASILGEVDLHLMGEGSHDHLYDRLGSHLTQIDGVDGAHFAVWAPNAKRVSVVGSFNAWDGRRHPMRKHPGVGVWDIFIPGLTPSDLYKYELLDAAGTLLPLKADPFARAYEPPPGNASRIVDSRYQWQDGDWMHDRGERLGLNAPMSVYEVHLGSWRRADNGARPLTYEELADELVAYAVNMGFTHLELMPISEHPFDGSWGYQPIGLFAPTWRFGSPDACRALIDRCHQCGLGVIVDWVAAHFPRDEHGLANFDGTALYEHADPRRGAHADWGTLIFNFGRREVVNYLISNALYWIKEFHVDALRVDAVASMLYLDYSREEGEWLPNEHGGNENLEAVAFFRELNAKVHAAGGVTMAEESTAWPMVSRPVHDGGLGFTYKWNLGWMNDTLRYMSEDPIARKYHHDKMTFALVYAFTENFILPLSHDEVVHGKRSIVGRMPGSAEQMLANLRAYYAFMFAHPGKKLLFMGAEIAQPGEWRFDSSLDWHLLADPAHEGVQSMVRDLNHLYVRSKPLYELDFVPRGFEWLEAGDRDNSVFAWARYAEHEQMLICVANFTPVTRSDYRLPLPRDGAYREVFSTDAKNYGGGGIVNRPLLDSEPVEHHGKAQSVSLTLPPLTTIFLEPVT